MLGQRVVADGEREQTREHHAAVQTGVEQVHQSLFPRVDVRAHGADTRQEQDVVTSLTPTGLGWSLRGLLRSGVSIGNPTRPPLE